MTQEQKVIRVKVGVMEQAGKLGNVSEAWRLVGFSGYSFYRLKELYDRGRQTALQKKSQRNPVLRNFGCACDRGPVVETAIAWGQVRLANELKRRGFTLSARGCAASGTATISRPCKSGLSAGGEERRPGMVLSKS